MGDTEIPTFHDLWSRGPVGPLIYGREYTKLFGEYKKNEIILNNSICVHPGIENWK